MKDFSLPSPSYLKRFRFRGVGSKVTLFVIDTNAYHPLTARRLQNAPAAVVQQVQLSVHPTQVRVVVVAFVLVDVIDNIENVWARVVHKREGDQSVDFVVFPLFRIAQPPVHPPVHPTFSRLQRTVRTPHVSHVRDRVPRGKPSPLFHVSQEESPILLKP